MKHSVFPEYEYIGVTGYELKTRDGFLKRLGYYNAK